MKDLFEVSFAVKVCASPLARGLTKPLAEALERAVPLLEEAVKKMIADMDSKPCSKE